MWRWWILIYRIMTAALQHGLVKSVSAMKRIGFNAHVIDDNLRQRTAGLFCGIIQSPFPASFTV